MAKRATTKKPAAPKSAMQSFIEDMAKSYKGAASFSTGESINAGWDRTPTPSLILNHKLRGRDVERLGGFAKGGVTEIAGMKGAGKTTLALCTIAEDLARHPEGYWVIADVECSIERWFLEGFGIDPDRVLRIRMTVAEDYSDAIEAVLSRPDLKILGVVLDSIAAMNPKQSAEGSERKTNIGANAKAMHSHMRKMIPLYAIHNIAALYLNHILTNPGVMFGSPDYTPGGAAPGFYSLTQIEMRRKQNTDTGHTVGFKITKNKPGGGYEKSSFDVPFRHDFGFDQEGELLRLGVVFGIIQGKYRVALDGGEVKLGNSEANATTFLRDNPEITNQLRDLVVPILNEQPLEYFEAHVDTDEEFVENEDAL